MEAKLTVTLLANAGLLLEYRGTRILLDGLYDEAGDVYSPPPADVTQGLLAGRGRFADIDYLLVTHDHPDHVSPGLLREYLAEHRPKCVFLPVGMLKKYPELTDTLTRRRIACFPLESAHSQMAFKLGEGLSLRPVLTHHVDKAFQDVPHFCYLLTAGERSALFTADVDYTQETFETLTDAPLAYLFVNPLFYHSRNDRAHCVSRLTPECWCVYHVPFPTEDTFGMGAMLRADAGRAEQPPLILDTALQKLILS